MAVVTSSVKPETQPRLQFPVKPTLSRRASAFSIDAIMASDCHRQLSHVTAGDAISGSGGVVATSRPSRRSLTEPNSARKSALSGQLLIF